MQTIKENYLRDATALLVLGGILLTAPSFVRGEEPAALPVPPRIVLPAMRVGGIAQGYNLQITERGSEMVAVARIVIASANTKVVVVAAAEAKAPPRLFCADSR